MSEEKCISLRDCLYPKPLDPPPKPIAWGRSYESVAVQKYVTERSNTTVWKSGLLSFMLRMDGLVQLQMVVHVHNEASQIDDILEVKCPYSKREVSPEKACNDSAFCCKLAEGEI